MTAQTAGLTDSGGVRQYNNDRYLIKEFPGDSVLISVADGMGELKASGLAADMAREYLAVLDPSSKDPSGDLAQIITEADRAIFSRSQTGTDFEGMGTTVTVAFVRDALVCWAHVGDSRLYHYSGAVLTQVTKDQNLAQFAVDEGEITLEQARGHVLANFLDQCVGCGECEVVGGRFEVKPGDILLVCSDGLHSQIRNRDLAAVLSADASLQTKARSLLQAALDADGSDNITLAAMEIA